METKSLLFGIIGFLLGGLVVSFAATQGGGHETKISDMTMNQMTEDLRGKSGDAYDEAFITGMIEHHRGAIEMAELSADRAKHDEIKQLSRAIIEAQQAEIEEMEQWRRDWGYHESMGH